MNVLLEDAGSLLVLGRVTDNLLDLLHFFCNLNADTSIGVFTRLDNPNILL